MNLMSVLCSQSKLISFVIAKYWYLKYPSNESSVKLDFNLHKNAFYWFWVHVYIAFLALCALVHRFNRFYHGNLNNLNYWTWFVLKFWIFWNNKLIFNIIVHVSLMSYFFFTSIASNLRRKTLYRSDFDLFIKLPRHTFMVIYVRVFRVRYKRTIYRFTLASSQWNTMYSLTKIN